MTDPLDQSISELLNASHDDEETLMLSLNDRSFGFHAQQSAEKLLKSLVAAHGHSYRYTHDIAELVRNVSALGERLPIPTEIIERLTEYAGVWRYQEPEKLEPAQRAAILEALAALKEFTLARLRALRPGLMWESQQQGE